VPSKNVAESESVDRRTRKREARRESLLDLAADLVEELGVDGVTMAALAEAADYAPASLYTYFPSRSALLAALQNRALATLRRVADRHVAAWDEALAAQSLADDVAALTRLWAFSDLFLAAPDTHPREFRLQQDLLVHAGDGDTADAVEVLPNALEVLEAPRRLLSAAEAAGALAPHPPVHDPLDDPVDGTVVRTLAWLVAMNGASLADRLTTGMPITGAALGTEITGALLVGWGADGERLTDARGHADRLR
jgi:AcrR family transcriptional regulator